ncbi:MAG: hypothetical protein QOE91_730 [Gaiellaceae bacterium]|jgi:hypothetical protein|nr:hypothetical protein [Gaiellaceae bacterium]
MRSLRHLALLFTAFVALGSAAPALAGGGTYAFAGGTAAQQGQVKAALNASSFNWSLVPTQIVIHIAPGIPSEATVGNIWLDSNLLNAGMFSWGVVQHEYAHQVDFFLLDDAKRQILNTELGGSDWCYSVAGLLHAQYGCERFASTLAWAYWPNAANSMRPTSAKDEGGAMGAVKFRQLMGLMIGAPTAAPPSAITAYAPKVVKPLRHPRPKKK